MTNSPRPRPTDEEFEVLKRKRNEALSQLFLEVCKKEGWDPSKAQMHASHIGPNDCYCACPDGPCQHIWDGPEKQSDEEDQGFWSSKSCSRCGAIAMFHDIRTGP